MLNLFKPKKQQIGYNVFVGSNKLNTAPVSELQAKLLSGNYKMMGYKSHYNPVYEH